MVIFDERYRRCFVELLRGGDDVEYSFILDDKPISPAQAVKLGKISN